MGYGDAGKTVNLVSADDIQRAIDRAHQRSTVRTELPASSAFSRWVMVPKNPTGTLLIRPLTKESRAEKKPAHQG